MDQMNQDLALREYVEAINKAIPTDSDPDFYDGADAENIEKLNVYLGSDGLPYLVVDIQNEVLLYSPMAHMLFYWEEGLELTEVLGGFVPGQEEHPEFRTMQLWVDNRQNLQLISKVVPGKVYGVQTISTSGTADVKSFEGTRFLGIESSGDLVKCVGEIKYFSGSVQ